MKGLKSKPILQKIIATLAIVIILFLFIPNRSYAEGWSLSGSLLKELMQLVSSLGDITTGLFNNVMLGADGVGSSMIDKDDVNLKSEKSWLYAGNGSKSDSDFDYVFESGKINTNSFIDLGDRFEVPNMLYSPENIFANNIAALDVNFLNPNTFTAAIENSSEATEKAESSASILKKTIANWYKSFRNIAVVGLLSVLLYLGIRILISSTAEDKAKYKESIKDWLVALCLVFVIHFIMAGILMLTDKVNDLFKTNINSISVRAYDKSEKVDFNTNLMGLVRFQAQSDDSYTTTAYTIMYMVLVIYTGIFTVMYFKRFLWTAFFTMIAPLVALTYPLDKLGDGTAQAFNMWLKEYMMNVIIQPVHLILYTVFVSSAIDLAGKNPLYAIVAIGFLIPAEKFIKQMFKLDKAQTTSAFGSFAGGALAMQGLNKMASLGNGRSKGKNGSSSAGAQDDSSSGKVRFNKVARDALGSFGNQSGNNSNGNKVLSTNSGGKNNGSSSTLIANKGSSKSTLGNNSKGNNNSQTNTGLASNKAGTPPIRKGAGKKLAIRGAKSVGKKVWKNKGKIARTGMKAIGTGMGATIGLAAGVATGDLSNAFTYAGAGAVAGNAIGNSAYNLGEGAIDSAKSLKESASGTLENMRYAADEELYGSQVANQYKNERRAEREAKENEKARKKFLKDENEIQKYNDIAYKMGYQGDVKDLMNAAVDYQIAGITDDEMIENALNAEYKNDKTVGGSSHENMIDIANLASKNDLGKKTFDDDKQYAGFERMVTATGLNEQQQENIKSMTAQLVGKTDVYEQRKKEKIAQQNVKKAEENERNARLQRYNEIKEMNQQKLNNAKKSKK